ncbi:MAG: DUF1761 domain-containing protein [bacterium]
MITTLILLGILGMVISVIIGTLWYSMNTPMGRVHMESIGFTQLSKDEQERLKNEMKPKMWKYYLAQMILSLLTSVFIAFIMLEQKSVTMGTGVIYGEVGLIWLCFTIPMVGQNLLWGNCEQKLRWKKFFSDIFANLVTYFVIVLVFSFFM